MKNNPISDIVNFVYRPEMTVEQKRKMYSALSKTEIIEMLIEANNHIELLAQNQTIFTISGNDCVHFPIQVTSKYNI